MGLDEGSEQVAQRVEVAAGDRTVAQLLVVLELGAQLVGLAGSASRMAWCGDRSRLGVLDGAALLHVATVGEALQGVTADALAQVDPELARRGS